MTAASPARQPRRLAGRAIAILAGCLAGIAGAELALRFFAPQPLALSHRTPLGLTVHMPSSRIRFARTEFDHTITLNSLGLRDREYSTSKPRGTFRILVLGDSYAEGAQVELEEIFAKQLEAGLQQRFPSRHWEVVNGGVAGYGTAEEIKFFQVYGRPLAPDLVILAFCAGNDLNDNRRSRFFRWEGDRLRELPLQPLSAGAELATRIKEFCASHSHLYQFLRYRYHVIRGFGDPNRGEVIRRHRMGVLRDDIDAALERDWQLTEALLDRLRDEVARAYAGFLLVSIPIRMQVEDAEWAEFEKAAGRPLDREAIQRHLAGWASARDVPFVDLLPALRDASRQQPVYFRIDAHWNARGHALAAREILAALASQGLLPEGKR